MSLDRNNDFNAYFECPAHSDGFLGFKYLPSASLGEFLSLQPYTVQEFPCSTLAFPGLLFSTSGSRAVGEPCSAIILKVKVNFNRF